MFRWYLPDWYNVGVGVAIVVLACGCPDQPRHVAADPAAQLRRAVPARVRGVRLARGFPVHDEPGDVPKISSRLGRPGGPSDRYILNRANWVFVNVVAAYPFYALPIFFPHLIWLGLVPILFNLAELVIHGGVATSALKAPYNPGLATSLAWLILSIWYITEIYRQHLFTSADWGIAIGYLIAWTVIALPVGTFVLLSDRNSPYPFASEELSRFEKYRRLIHTTVHP